METVNEVYEFIGKCIFDEAPSAWDSASLKIEALDGMVGLKGGFDCGGEFISFDKLLGSFELMEGVETLHRITSVDSESQWNKAEYILKPSGKFKVNFEWDQEMVDEVERLAKE